MPLKPRLQLAPPSFKIRSALPVNLREREELSLSVGRQVEGREIPRELLFVHVEV